MVCFFQDIYIPAAHVSNKKSPEGFFAGAGEETLTLDLFLGKEAL